MKKETNVVLIGLGYIGLPTAALIASKGIRVHGVDVNPKVVETINQGKIHIVEPDLDGLVKHVVERGLLKASLTPEKGDVFVVAVPTPFKENHEPDLSYVEAAARSVISHLNQGDLFIIESTSPVGTTEHIYEMIVAVRPELKDNFYIAYCPERVLPGNVIHELKHNDRVIGGMNLVSTEKAIEFYSMFVSGQLHRTNARTAEMCKLVENSYRDTNIAFANELSMICDEAKINVWELIQLANRHPRVKILQPGPGVGGHCIAVDPWFIVSSAPEESRLIRTARLVNDTKPEWVISKVEAAVSELAAGRDGAEAAVTVACLGLAFKADIDDLRESPAVAIAAALGERLLGRVVSVEPNIDALPKHLAGMIELASVADALAVADVIVLLVDHQPFRSTGLDELGLEC